MMFDTDILIWAQHGHYKAIKKINDAQARSVSIITYMEFIQGAQNKRQQTLSENFFKELEFQVITINQSISHRAATLIEQFSLSHTLDILDSIIAATAVECGYSLLTANYKDYRMINGLDLVVFKP